MIAALVIAVLALGITLCMREKVMLIVTLSVLNLSVCLSVADLEDGRLLVLTMSLNSVVKLFTAVKYYL